MKIGMRYDTQYGDRRPDEPRTMVFTIEPETAAERMLFDALLDSDIQPTLTKKDKYPYPTIEFSLKLK